jgi:LysM repeat protein
MKSSSRNQPAPVWRRQPTRKTIWTRLHAITGRNQPRPRKDSRRQAVAATAHGPADFHSDEPPRNISRPMIIIFILHVVVIGVLFFHHRFLDGRNSPAASAATAETTQNPTASAPASTPAQTTRLSSSDEVYIVRQGDNYARIASAQQVDEAELRALNPHEPTVRPGLLLKLPPKRIVAIDPPEVTEIRNRQNEAADRGLVATNNNATPPTHAAVEEAPPPRAQVVAPAARPVNPASGKTYIVKPGDTIWRISLDHNVDQNDLMRANNISNPKQLRADMKLRIP